MLKNREFWRKTGIPLVTMLSEELFLAVYLFLLTPEGSGFLSRVLENGSVDDSITGWLIGPALLGDALIFLGLVVVFLLVVIFAGFALFAGIWNIIFNCINKNRTKGLFIGALIPSVLWIIGFLPALLMMSSILLWIPLIVHVAGLILQIYLFRLGVEIN